MKYKYSRKEIEKLLTNSVYVGLGYYKIDDVQFWKIKNMLLDKSAGKEKCTCVNCLNKRVKKSVIDDAHKVYKKLSRPTLQPIEKVKPSMLNYPSEMEAIVCLVRDVFEKQQEVIDRINLLSIKNKL